MFNALKYCCSLLGEGDRAMYRVFVLLLECSALCFWCLFLMYLFLDKLFQGSTGELSYPTTRWVALKVFFVANPTNDGTGMDGRMEPGAHWFIVLASCVNILKNPALVL